MRIFIYVFPWALLNSSEVLHWGLYLHWSRVGLSYHGLLPGFWGEGRRSQLLLLACLLKS